MNLARLGRQELCSLLICCSSQITKIWRKSTSISSQVVLRLEADESANEVTVILPT